MNISTIRLFLDSEAYHMLAEEATHNNHAMELMDMINMSLQSIIFFKKHKINNRVSSETINLHKLFTFITEIYEQD